MSSVTEHTTHVQQLFVQHGAAVKYFVLSLLPSPAEAEDVVQEVFLTVTAKAHDFEEGTNFKSWAFAIARFKVLEFLRARKRAPMTLSQETMELLADESSEDLFGEDLHAMSKLNETLSQCLDKLPPKARRLVELVYQDGLKPGAVAEEVGWSAQSVYVALSRARTTLHECIVKRTQTNAL